MPTPASPGTNQYRCNACGRYFNTRGELAAHEIECRAAKSSTPAGARELAEQDSRPHAPNDRDAEDMPSKRKDRRDEGKAFEERPVPSQAEGEDR